MEETVAFVDPIYCPECKAPRLTAEIDAPQEIRNRIEEKTGILTRQTCHSCLKCNTVFYTADEFPPNGFIIGKAVFERHHINWKVDL